MFPSSCQPTIVVGCTFLHMLLSAAKAFCNSAGFTEGPSEMYFNRKPFCEVPAPSGGEAEGELGQ